MFGVRKLLNKVTGQVEGHRPRLLVRVGVIEIVRLKMFNKPLIRKIDDVERLALRIVPIFTEDVGSQDGVIGPG